MFELLATSLFSLFLGTEKVPLLKATDWSKWGSADWVQVSAPVTPPDPVAQSAVQQHLATLEKLGMPAVAQGLWVQVENQVLAEHRGTEATPAASLTKIPTTLAALATWEPDHQFETLVGTTGPVQDGVLQGDLVIQGSGDPLFVWEEAIALGNTLNQLGVSRVTGNLVIVGEFGMNFEGDPQKAGALLRQGLNADLWTAEATQQHAQMPPSTSKPRVAIAGTVQVFPSPPAFTPLIRHQSLPLTQILKAMNIFSNNFIADSLAEELGGGNAIARKAAEITGIPQAEIQLVNGSGLGMGNRISPRAVVAMLKALQEQLQGHDLNVADLFPVMGRERGTLRDRQIAPGTPLKTGTLDEVSSLAGVLPTRDRGLVWFSIMDIGTADLTQLHNRQDIFLQAMTQQWGVASPVPPALQPSDRLKSYQEVLGDPARNQVVRP